MHCITITKIKKKKIDKFLLWFGLNLSRWKKGIAMDFYGASRNKKMKSDGEFLRGPRKSKVRFHDFIYIES